MTPREKVVDLVNEFFPTLSDSIAVNLVGKRKSFAKKCALIAVDEILKTLEWYKEPMNDAIEDDLDYWQQVKTEIENL